MQRKLRVSDFDNKLGLPIKAIYNGNSRYLEYGRTYYVTLNELSGKATVQAGFNPGMQTNGGVQFAVGSFLIEIEEENKMVKFEDLTPEDQEKILEQARQIVDEENTKKHAVAMYNLKKKELTETYLDELGKNFNIKSGPDASALKQRYVSTVNFLYKIALGKKYHGSNVKAMSTEKEWITYQDISSKVKNMMINCQYM